MKSTHLFVFLSDCPLFTCSVRVVCDKLVIDFGLLTSCLICLRSVSHAASVMCSLAFGRRGGDPQIVGQSKIDSVVTILSRD
jgi:hypothetical protein